MGIIYGLIDSDTLELRYVGKTVMPLEKRLADHRCGRSTNRHLNNWLRAKPVSIITLERDSEDLNEAECRWIAAMRVEGARLLNITDGGNGGAPSVETRAKISAALMGYKHTATARAKMRAAALGRVASVEARAKMRDAHLGLKHSAETRAKISAALLGHTVSAEALTKAVKT
mgnify:CR=1 FL=1